MKLLLSLLGDLCRQKRRGVAKRGVGGCGFEILAFRGSKKTVVGQAAIAWRRCLIGWALVAGGVRGWCILGGGAHTGRARSASRKHSGVGEGGIRAPPEGIGRNSRGSWCPLTRGGTLTTRTLSSSSSSISAIQTGLRAETRLLTGLEERGGGLLQTLPTIHLEREQKQGIDREGGGGGRERRRGHRKAIKNQKCSSIEGRQKLKTRPEICTDTGKAAEELQDEKEINYTKRIIYPRSRYRPADTS